MSDEATTDLMQIAAEDVRKIRQILDDVASLMDFLDGAESFTIELGARAERARDLLDAALADHERIRGVADREARADAQAEALCRRIGELARGTR